MVAILTIGLVVAGMDLMRKFDGLIRCVILCAAQVLCFNHGNVEVNGNADHQNNDMNKAVTDLSCENQVDQGQGHQYCKQDKDQQAGRENLEWLDFLVYKVGKVGRNVVDLLFIQTILSVGFFHNRRSRLAH